MSEKLINFREMKRKEIRKIIGEDILIYNPSPEKRKEMEKIITRNSSEDGKEINISNIDIILELIPLCTNIDLELDRNNPEDAKIIKEIVDDPSDEFLEVITEVTIVFKNIAEKYLETINSLAKLSKDELAKVTKNILGGQETPEQKRIKQLKKELSNLEAVKDNIKEVK